jgi:hypothetical protein
MQSTARTDYCPDCKYEYYYGDAHGIGEAQISRLINPGRDEPSKRIIVSNNQIGEEFDEVGWD